MVDGSGRLGDYVAARRRELGLTRVQVHQAGGPSVTRLGTIEEGAGPGPSAQTLQKLDTGLRWQPGSAARTLTGGLPTPLPDTAESDGLISASQVAVSVDELAGLIRAVNRLTDTYDATNTDISDSVRAVQQSASRLAGRWATEVLERNRHSSTQIPAVLELAFGHLLDAPTAGTPEPEHTERLYRRWLSGRVTDLTPEQCEQFAQRLHRRRSGQTT
ncbi:helix-turn-helix domain-containing protein [Prescottella subtropica]|uniref:helix-turn-helix domain-containing protein n=1 Tax=Prescottella subtropica TaxID=2545757 RepID=UPI0010F823CF|nr:helix-turn-helix transcriptional regulator [Prescottella subtropica]